MTTYSLAENECHSSTPDVKCMENAVDILPLWNHKTILLVDDQIDVLITIKSMLQTCGYSVDAFNDPLLAVEHFSQRSHEYGIVISDVMMPFMSGFEFIKQVRAVNPEIVTFVITASDGIKDINKDAPFLYHVLYTAGGTGGFKGVSGTAIITERFYEPGTALFLDVLLDTIRSTT